MNSPLPENSIRLATEEDLAQVLEIEKKAYPLPWTKEQFSEELKKPFSRFLLLTDDETDSEVFSYIVYWQMFEECHLLNITVHPDWRGLGLAKKMMRFLLSECIRKKCKKVFLEVRTSNEAAVAFYQSFGFFIDHTKKAFYANGDNAYFMTLFIDDKNSF